MTERLIATAELAKRTTEDGLVEIEDHIPLGKTYKVDINSKRMAEGVNIVHNIKWEREVINVVDPTGDWWMPTELLRILEN